MRWRLRPRLARDPSPAVRREVALSLRDVPLESARDILLTLAAGYDGKDRSYLEAWGIGATGKEDALYTALAASAVRARCREVAGGVRGSRVAPDADRGSTGLRRARPRGGAAFAERTKATTALGFIPTPEAANALLDVAQHGGSDIKQNPALWWLISYKDSRWAGQGIDAELKRRGLYDPDTVAINEVTVPAPPETSALPAVADIVKLRGDAKRGSVAAGACLMCHRIKGQGVDYAPALDGFASRQTREVVVTAIVNPSNDIAHGYEGAEITLTDGRKIHGLVLSGGNPTLVQSTGGVDADGPRRAGQGTQVARSLTHAERGPVGLSGQQVADIAAYLR